MKRLTRGGVEEFLADDDLVTEDVEVPEWDLVIRVRELSGIKRDEYETSLVHVNGKDVHFDSTNMRGRLVALSAVDEKGELLFTVEQAEALGKKSARGLSRVYRVCQRISRIGDEELELLGKDSAGTTTGERSTL